MRSGMCRCRMLALGRRLAHNTRRAARSRFAHASISQQRRLLATRLGPYAEPTRPVNTPARRAPSSGSVSLRSLSWPAGCRHRQLAIHTGPATAANDNSLAASVAGARPMRRATARLRLRPGGTDRISQPAGAREGSSCLPTSSVWCTFGAHHGGQRWVPMVIDGRE